MDNLVFEESLNTEIDQSEFISKKWIYVNDNNNGNYTSQIVLDSTPLSNAGGWINWQEGFMLLPLIVQLTSATAGSLPQGSPTLANYSWAFKSGFWNLINSMSVEFNNQNIVQQTPFLNVFRSFKAHTSFSQDDLLNEGSSIGYYPDSAGSWSYQNVANVGTGTLNGRGAGVGIANNTGAELYSSNSFITTATGYVINSTTNQPLPSSGIAGVPVGTPAGATTTIQYNGAGNPSSAIFNENSCNKGMRTRQSWYGYDGNANGLGQNLVNTGSACDVVYRSHRAEQTQDGSVIWKVYAKLRLKDIAEFFEKTPLLKGSTMRFYINTNQSVVNFTTALGTINNTTGAITATPKLTINSVNVIGGLTNPLMVASNQFGQGCSSLPADTYNLSVSIFRNTFSSQNAYTAGQSSLTACRLYAPVYTMNPLSESKYLSLAPTRKVLYRDIFQYQFNNVAKGNFNFLVSNGINNIKSVLVVPFISKSNPITNSAGNPDVLPFASVLSPCSTAPSTPDPIMLTNFNILVSGINLFLNNEYYDFEAFREQLLSSNQLNGSLTTGLASGLISEDMFSRLYRYYYGDCSRVLPSEQGVSRSVQIIGQNASELIIDIMVFVEFQREITIDVSTGARIE
jgi:hypothetical protein